MYQRVHRVRDIPQSYSDDWQYNLQIQGTYQRMVKSVCIIVVIFPHSNHLFVVVVDDYYLYYLIRRRRLTVMSNYGLLLVVVVVLVFPVTRTESYFSQIKDQRPKLKRHSHRT